MARNFPIFSVKTDTKDITGLIKPRLVSLTLNDRSGVHADSMEMTVADDGQVPWPEEGSGLEVAIGYEGQPHRGRKRFAIDQVEHSGPPARFSLSATAADFTGGARAPREASYSQVSFGELVNQLAGRHGYEAKVEPFWLAAVTLQQVDQAGRSDLGLIHELAASHGAVFKPVDGLWWVRSFDMVSFPVAILGPTDVNTWRGHFSSRRVNQSVVAAYQDYDQAERVRITVGKGEPQKVLDETFPDEATARAKAEAELARSKREARGLSLSLPGRPELASQSVIALNGFGGKLDDQWRLKSVTHTLDKRGYKARVECEGV